MVAFLHELEQLAADVEIHSPTTFTFRGHRIDGTEGDDHVGSRESPTTRTREMLERLLYAALHTREPVLSGATERRRDWNGAQEFVDRLSRANGGIGTWQSGWRAHGVASDGRVVAEKYGLQFRVRPERFRPDDQHQTGATGTGSVLIAGEFRELTPGFYMALGNADDELDGAAPCVRVYWHVRAAGAAALMAGLTGSLNDAAIPFRFKVESDPLRYQRTDAAVLYLPAAICAEAWPLLRVLRVAMHECLRPTVSAFVKPLAPGVGMAEDPGDGSSFGQHRCRVLVAALLSADVVSAATTPARLDALVRGIRHAGLDERAFHLQPGSVDRFPPFE